MHVSKELGYLSKNARCLDAQSLDSGGIKNASPYPGHDQKQVIHSNASNPHKASNVIGFCLTLAAYGEYTRSADSRSLEHYQHSQHNASPIVCIPMWHMPTTDRHTHTHRMWLYMHYYAVMSICLSMYWPGRTPSGQPSRLAIARQRIPDSCLWWLVVMCLRALESAHSFKPLSSASTNIGLRLPSLAR